MFGNNCVSRFRRMLDLAQVELNGSDPSSIQVSPNVLPKLAQAVMSCGSLGAAETWVDELWHCQALDRLICKIAKSREAYKSLLLNLRVAKLFLARQLPFTRQPEASKIAKHYNERPELFEAMLGPDLVYSCGYWKVGTQTLEEAQRAKLDLVGNKLVLAGMKSGQEILDIGCGFGSLCLHLCRSFYVSTFGINISSSQLGIAKSRLSRTDRVQLREIHYLALPDSRKFPYAASVGMFEHVGAPCYRKFFRKVAGVLEPGGLFLLHTIGTPTSAWLDDPFIQRDVFPGGHIPDRKEIEKSSRGILEVVDWHEFSSRNYARTLGCWHQNLLENWPSLSHIFDRKVRRFWEFYLLYCKGAFEAELLDTWQIAFVHPGIRLEADLSKIR